MHRFYRLISPAAAFVLVGSVLITLARLPAFRLHGGLAVTGVYSLALQIAVTLFLLTAIDDVQDRRTSMRVDRSKWNGSILDAIGTTYGFRHALLRLYLWRFAPAFLLAFGVAESLTTISIGLFDRTGAVTVIPDQLTPLVPNQFAYSGARSEVILTLVLLAIALMIMRKGVLAFIGWCFGFAAGIALGQILLAPIVSVGTTLVAWLSAAALLCVIRLGTYGWHVVRYGHR